MKRNEIWYINFDPTIGKEIKKIRPAIIIDDDYLASRHMRFVVPLTTWQDKFEALHWIMKIMPNHINGLTNPSGVNIQQARYLSTNRFQNKIGTIDDNMLVEIQKNLIRFINPNLHKIL